MRRRSLALCCWILLAPVPASAGRVLLSVDQSIVGQSNVFKTGETETSDASYELTPRIRFFDPDEKFFYDVEYSPSFEAFFRTDGFNGVDHFVRSRLQYHPTRIDAVDLRADIANYRAIRATTVDGPMGIPDVIPGAQGEVTRVFIDAGYERQITRATVASVTAGIQHYSYTEPTNVDNTGAGGELSLVHELVPNFAIGASIFGSYRSYEPGEFQAGSENGVLNANLILRMRPTPSTSLDFKIGPAGIFVREPPPGPIATERFNGAESDLGTLGALYRVGTGTSRCGEFMGQPVLSECPLTVAPALTGRLDERVVVDYDDAARPAGNDINGATFFMAAELRKEDSWGHASLEFVRTEDASAGSGFTTIRNSLTGSALYEYDEHWSFRSRINWNRRTSEGRVLAPVVRAGESEVPVGFGGLFYAEANGLIPNETESKVDQWWFDLLATRELTDHLQIEMMFRYQWQRTAASLGVPERTFDNLLGSLMIRYEFDPMDYLP
jgi:hypothetical protein